MLIHGPVVTIGLLGAMLAPPEEGPMMVIPLGGDAMAGTMDCALADGAAFMGADPLPGSILVHGQREPITDGAWRHNCLVIRAPALVCGTLFYP